MTFTLSQQEMLLAIDRQSIDSYGLYVVRCKRRAEDAIREYEEACEEYTRMDNKHIDKVNAYLSRVYEDDMA